MNSYLPYFPEVTNAAFISVLSSYKIQGVIKQEKRAQTYEFYKKLKYSIFLTTGLKFGDLLGRGWKLAKKSKISAQYLQNYAS